MKVPSSDLAGTSVPASSIVQPLQRTETPQLQNKLSDNSCFYARVRNRFWGIVVFACILAITLVLSSGHAAGLIRFHSYSLKYAEADAEAQQAQFGTFRALLGQARQDRRASRKVFLVPPLSVVDQWGSPVQARGFSLARLEPGRVVSGIFWYDPETGGSARWLWDLDRNDQPLERVAVLLIAFLTAFLTIVAIWQIPPTDEPLLEKSGQPTAPKTPEPSPFTSRFGKTVLAGLGGLVVTEVTKGLGNQPPSPDSKWFYIIWFIIFFFVLLLSLGLIRAIAEAVRVRVAMVYYPLSGYMRERRQREEEARKGKVTLRMQAMDFFSYWRLRIVQWLASLRVPILTFFDTFIYLIQGKNQTMTNAFASSMIEQHRNRIRVADAIRKEISEVIEWSLMDPTRQAKQPESPMDVPQTILTEVMEGLLTGRRGGEKQHTQPMDIQHAVRVNISVLSADSSGVFYISRSVGSLQQTFPKRSVAWVSVYTGQIRWYCESEMNEAKDFEILLFNNQDHIITAEGREIWLRDYYQSRDQDYKAFVVLPVPWARHAAGAGYVKGAIHISFREESDFKKIWDVDKIMSDVERESKQPHDESKSKKIVYLPDMSKMVWDWCKDCEVRTVLRSSLVVLGELLRGFDEDIFKNYIEPAEFPRESVEQSGSKAIKAGK